MIRNRLENGFFYLNQRNWTPAIRRIRQYLEQVYPEAFKTIRTHNSALVAHLGLEYKACAVHGITVSLSPMVEISIQTHDLLIGENGFAVTTVSGENNAVKHKTFDEFEEYFAHAYSNTRAV